MKSAIGFITLAAAVSFGTGVWADAPVKHQRETGQPTAGQQNYQCSQENQQGFQALQLNQQRYQERWNQQRSDTQNQQRQDQSAFNQLPSAERQGMNQGSSDPQRFDQRGTQDGRGMNPNNASTQPGSKERQDMNRGSSDSNQQGVSSQDTRGKDRSTQSTLQDPTERQGMNRGSSDSSNLQASNQVNRQGTNQGTSDSKSNTQTINGEFVGMYGTFYVLKDARGQQLCLPTSNITTLDGTFVPGDTIEARMDDGSATTFKRVGNSSSDTRNPGSGSMSGSDSSMTSSDSMSGSNSMSANSKSQMSTDANAQQNSALLVTGELLKIKDEFYTVKDAGGNEVRLHVNKETKIEGAPRVGDQIEAQRTAAGHALSIKKAGS